MLIEGQGHQVAMLQKRTPIRVFIPMDLERAIELMKYGLDSRPGNVQRELSGKGVVRALEVEYNLDTAAKEGAIVVGVTIQGRHMYPATSSSRLEQYASQRYPKSFNPVVSHLLLDNPPDNEVILNAQISLSDVTKFYLIRYDGEGYHDRTNTQVKGALTPEEFQEWLILLRGRHAEMKSGQTAGNHRWQQMHRLHGDKGHTSTH